MNIQRISAGVVTSLVLALTTLSAHALDYRSVTAPAIMYDSPSNKGKPLYIINAGTPVEALVPMEGWIKVRDMQGTLAWIEKKNLSEKRMLLVRADRAQIRKEADDKSALVFETERDVVLEMLAPVSNGWVQVKHRDGQSGFVRVQQVSGL
ncbi:MAG TPA: SH3 domain-containing protein [Rhodocyclaceae bacterium]|jgi:SH3-like domain-containing protein|nr:SH3 domain-containing protein [Rhodocyclaceae bacterium]